MDMTTLRVVRAALPVFFVIILSGVCVLAADPDPLQDFCVADFTQSIFINGFPCRNPATVTSADVAFEGLRTPGNISASPLNAAAKFAFVEEFPALNTLGIAMIRLDWGVGGLVPPHTHPRGSEILYLIKGSLYAGFVNGNNTLYAKDIHAGDVIIFPRGLIHFQLNIGKGPAMAITALNSQDAGFQVIANSIFGSDIRNEVLEKAFYLSATEVQRLKGIFSP